MNSNPLADQSKSDTGKVLLQLAREMLTPFFIAIGWTVYSLTSNPAKQNIVDAITVFGGAFFLACWAFAQWFRVMKQQAVESGLGGIVKKQEALVIALTEATERLEGQTSGGKSVGWLMLGSPRDGAFREIVACVHGDYPLIEARASVLDLEKTGLGIAELKQTGNIHDFFKHNVMFECGTLQVKRGHLQHQAMPCDAIKPVLRFRVDWTARNGSWTQNIELKLNGNRYESFTAVQRGDEWVFENPSRDSIPKRPDGTPDVFWYPELADARAGGSA